MLYVTGCLVPGFNVLRELDTDVPVVDITV